MPTFEFVKTNEFRRRKSIYVCGFGAVGSLGISKYYRPDIKGPENSKKSQFMQSKFRRLPGFSKSDTISDIACGYGFTTIAAKLAEYEHTALGFGLNTHSQIGYQYIRPGYPLEIVSSPSAIIVPTKSPIQKLACGRSHTLLLNASGQVYSIGNNSFGQCGRPIKEHEVYFGSKLVHHISNLPENIAQIECGQDHSLFLTENGTLFACGWGADGQTGLGHYENQEEPAQVKGDLEGVKIIKVSSCADTVMALDDQGNVFGWGNTEYAQFRVIANCSTETFNIPRKLKFDKVPGKIVDIATGGTMCAILNDKGQVYVWGFGILGRGPDVDQSSHPSLIPETLFGMNGYDPDVKVVSISAGLSQFAAITNRGDLYTWGKNRGGLLGFAHSSDQLFPMRVNMNCEEVVKISMGVDHSVAIVQSIQ